MFFGREPFGVWRYHKRPPRRRIEAQYDDDSRYYRSHRLYFDCRCRQARLMNPLVEFIFLTGTPFLIGPLTGYSLRSYVSVLRRRTPAAVVQCRLTNDDASCPKFPGSLLGADRACNLLGYPRTASSFARGPHQQPQLAIRRGLMTATDPQNAIRLACPARPHLPV
jgi:hypothetical protein